MFYTLRRKLNYSWFNLRNQAAYHTPPVHLSADGPSVITQVCRDDIVMYLIAIKSFAKYIPPSTVFVLDDGSLSSSDHAMLRHHIPQLQLLSLSDFQSAHCPKGACWERLQAIAELCKKHYVVQLDSDTITLNNIDEVAQAIEQDTSFVIGTEDGQDFDLMPAAVSAGRSRLSTTKHIQIAAEANFDKLQGHETMRYVRGCAGFTGFAKNSFSLDFIELISRQMYQAIGARWNEWGTEQVTSNIAVSNCPRTTVLPHPKYSNCQRIRGGLTVFIHFIGPCRFTKGTYSRFLSSAILQLGRNARSI